MRDTACGYREIEHTADWELAVWASDLPSLLEQAARGMYSLMGARLQERPRIQRVVEIRAIDAESLLVEFLSELLYYAEQEELGFDRFQLSLDKAQDFSLRTILEGAPLAGVAKEIKAVTYHGLEVRNLAGGSDLRSSSQQLANGERRLEVNIVFDV